MKMNLSNYNEIVVVGNGGQNVSSIYQLHPNGLYMPPHVTYTPQEWVASNPYPEFAQGLVAEYDKMLSAPKPYGKVIVSTPPIKKYGVPAWQEPQPDFDLQSIVPEMEVPHNIKCINCSHVSSTVSNIIVHLNDDHHWTREKIANYLDTLPYDLRIRKVA
jgi:hypothetical protein